MTTEANFYKRHYHGGVTADSTALADFEASMLAPEKRYHLVEETLRRERPNGGVIAEIGCGGAQALLILSRRYRFDRVVGVDIATASAGMTPEGIEIIEGNLNERWPFGDAEVDILIAMMVIEHLFDPFHSFREIKRSLAKTGMAFVNLPLVTSVRNRMRLLAGKLPTTSIAYETWFADKEWDGNHLHYFSMAAIHGLARDSGLRVSDVQGVGTFGRLKTWLPAFFASEVTFCLKHDG